MSIIKKIRNKLNYTVVAPLKYDEPLRAAYSTVGVTGGILRGRTAVVTGATSGIGYSTAQRLLSEGCNVIITGRNEKKLKDSVSTLMSDKSVKIDYHVLDSLNEKSFKEKVDKLFEKYSVEIWINCAGILKTTDRERKFRGIDADTYFDVVNTNLKSNMLLIPLVADKMTSREIKGTIISVSSICGFTNHFGYTPYGISKNGLIEFTKRIADNYKDNVNILSVAPGSVATRMGTTGFGKNISGSSSFIRHVAIPEEIASVIAFLATPIGRKLSGQTILASAGEKV